MAFDEFGVRVESSILQICNVMAKMKEGLSKMTSLWGIILGSMLFYSLEGINNFSFYLASSSFL